MSLRNLVVGTKPGRLVLFGMPFTAMSLFTARYLSFNTVVIFLGSGIIFALLMNRSFERRYGYFIENIQLEKYAETRRFARLYRRRQIPESKADYPEFRKFLDASERVIKTSRSGAVPCVIIFSIIAGTLIITRGFRWSDGLLLAGTALLVGNLAYTKVTLRKIATLRSQL